VFPPALRMPFKNIFLCSSFFPLGEYIEKQVDPKGKLAAGGSVATTAWDFARSLGAKEIWIAGLDLAFPDLKTHFRGALFEEKAHSESSRFKPAETTLLRALRDGFPFYAPSGTGAKVLTDRRLSLYAAWFENRFSQCKDIRNYNIFPGGLAIKGLESADTEKLLALPQRRDEINKLLNTVFSQIENDFFNPQEKQKRQERYNTAVCTLKRGLEQIKTNAEKGAEIAEQALKRSRTQAGRNQLEAEQGQILKKLDEITEKISNSEVKEIAGFLFPQEEAAEMGKEPAEGSSHNPFLAYLKSSASFFRLISTANDETNRVIIP